jgi:hypothetical protein
LLLTATLMSGAAVVPTLSGCGGPGFSVADIGFTVAAQGFDLSASVADIGFDLNHDLASED